MSILVAYATHTGATRTLAETIAETLTAQGCEVALADIANDPDPGAHEAVILGSGIRMDALEKSAIAWADQHREQLAGRPVALFTCSGSAADPRKEGKQKGTDHFLARAGFTPVAVRNFPGWVILDKMALHERALMRTLRTPLGDFRDLPAVAAWAREISPLLVA
ncbi:flavodoxin domain-containing protein [Brachybacterium sp. EF45031]|uniref:flavodoxin domain-containing protein n=1 Tax=Brachybacterium sillae TaxID=2810536 RepID=UPI00217D9DE0|nr:flavodoxin domain-containing protein [Brachybacterium sillae]MCS6710803.1 flavodoxin domain-containing protein [Brachybacterium sillae]